MPPLSSDGEMPHLSATGYPLAPDLHERLKVLEQQCAMEHQRQRDQVDAELHKLQQQLLAMTREQQQQHQALRATLRETMEELRKEVSEALHHLSQDVAHVAQQAEVQTGRALERLRNELLATLFAREHTAVPRQVLGELFIALGRQLQEAGKEDAS
ncbi:MAG: hypothetical protein FJZ47_17665 [Candidatus Tectomicrobia bacterium]|uniref:Uncharacterized protein n=1 Tax=Tectimicrobiota bacterium TaxID=2528274 RepID=A0A937W3N6_UNCTE|nr:hypothetical protein [Candidatus Tectomicrobia bacterium]